MGRKGYNGRIGYVTPEATREKMIKPLNSNLLIQLKKEEKTKSGIILAEEKRFDEALVVAVAPEVKAIKKGDTIFLKDYSTDEIEIEGKKLCFVKEENVLAIKK